MRGVIIVIDINVPFSREKILSERELIIIINNNVEEAKACTIKYFIEASVVYTLLYISINGINDSRLISNPIHAPNHELEDTGQPISFWGLVFSVRNMLIITDSRQVWIVFFATMSWPVWADLTFYPSCTAFHLSGESGRVVKLIRPPSSVRFKMIASTRLYIPWCLVKHCGSPLP
jgi:hypothetical protein